MQPYSKVVIAEKGGAHKDSAEEASLRNFLIYCLAVDYRVSAPQPLMLSASEHEHCTEMSDVLWDLRDSHFDTHLTAAERRKLAP